MMIREQAVPNKILGQFRYGISLAKPVQWTEKATMEGELEGPDLHVVAGVMS